MIRSGDKKRAFIMFAVSLAVALALLAASIIQTVSYNRREHCVFFSAEDLFDTENDKSLDVNVAAAARSSTWTKLFDFNNEGLTENNFQAYTYDFTVSNNTKDIVDSFTFKLTFSTQVYLSSAWNGALEIHQIVKGGEIVATIPDLRDYKPEDYPLEMQTVDGETFISMKPGDYLVYYPSTSTNALEMPIEPFEGTTPGIILYMEIGDSMEDSLLELDYRFHRLLTSDPLFWVSMAGLFLWVVGISTHFIISSRIKAYQERHERDNEIINESIETFTGFIDAKDPYTNGHSKRVAIYTRRIAHEFGYEGEELDRIYYIALLHDCGKIGVPDNILGKPGRLTDEEFEIIKSHTIRGGEILASFRSLKDADEGARYHHERYDGKGYPEGLAGENIPFIARMICVADSFDAMNTNRVYRNKLTKEKIISELESCSGKQFDPKVAEVMLRLIKEGGMPVEG